MYWTIVGECKCQGALGEWVHPWSRQWNLCLQLMVVICSNLLLFGRRMKICNCLYCMIIVYMSVHGWLWKDINKKEGIWCINSWNKILTRTRQNPKQRNNTFIAVLHLKVTVRPSTRSNSSLVMYSIFFYYFLRPYLFSTFVSK